VPGVVSGHVLRLKVSSNTNLFVDCQEAAVLRHRVCQALSHPLPWEDAVSMK